MRHTKEIFIATLIILVYSTATYQRNGLWRDPEALGKDIVRKSPEKGRPYYNLGNYYVTQGRIDEAIEQFQKAISVRPTSQEYNNLGLAYESKGMVDSAIEMFQVGISLDSSNAEAYNNLGKAYLVYQRRIDDAIVLFNKAIELKSDYTDPYVNLAAAYILGKRFHAVVPILETVIVKDFGRFDAHYNLGIAYHCLGNVSAAKRARDILRVNAPSLAVGLEKIMNHPCDNRTHK